MPSAKDGSARRGGQSRLAWLAVAALPTGFIGLFVAWPLTTIVWRGLTQDGTVDALALARVALSEHTLNAAGTTVSLAAMGAAASVLFGVPCAYGLYRLEWPGVRVARILASVPFVLPTVVVAAAFSALLRRGGPLGGLGIDQSAIAIVAAFAFYNTSIVIRVVGTAWAGLNPQLRAAAQTLGASRAKAFLHVTARSLAPSIASAALLAFLMSASSFGVVIVLGGSTVTTIETAIYFEVTQFLDLRSAAVLSLVQLLIVGAALALSDSARRANERHASRLTFNDVRRAKGPDLWAAAGAVAIVALLNGVPLSALIARSFMGRDGLTLSNYAAAFSPPPGSTLPVSLLQAAMTSVTVALCATVIATATALVVAGLARVRSAKATTLEAITALPLSVSAVMVGLGLLLTLNRQIGPLDLRGSWWLLPLGQAVVALPFAARILVPAAREVDPRLRMSAMTLGASPVRVWWHVDMPLMRRALAVAAGFAAAMSLGEFGASAFLARPDAPTLPAAIVRLLGRPGFDQAGMAFAGAVMLAALSAGIVAAVDGRQRKGDSPW